MLSHRRRLTATASGPRIGFTLAEALLALVLGGLVLGLITSIGTHLQRQLHSEANRIDSEEQLAAAAMLSPDIRALSPAAGDIRAGEARDSSLELRVTLASALVCGNTARTLILAPYLGPFSRPSVPAFQRGDTAWILTDSDSSEAWQPTVLQTLQRTSGVCPAIVVGRGGAAFDVAHLWAASVSDSLGSVSGAIVRVTRPLRYSFYQAGDGKTYLGVHTWNVTTSQFNLVQPISGPYAPSTPRSLRTRFRFFDSTDVALPSGLLDTRRIARIEVLLASDSVMQAPSRDSLLLVLALRNR
jgi:hypothetical protein